MQKNIFLKVEYIGSRYFGFQLQAKKGVREISVQKVIEGALRKLFKKRIRITYASRTDRGVHAREQAVNFKVDTNIPLKNVKTALNSFLPKDVRVKTAKYVPSDFHSRFWTKSKIYRYIILNRKEPSVFWRDFSWHIDKPLNVQGMKKASSRLIGRKNFSLFAKEAHSYRDTVRNVMNIGIKKRNSFIYIDIEANGFLRNMARNIVSFLVKVGEGKIKVQNISGIIKGKLSYINKPAPSSGLYLWKVKYE